MKKLFISLFLISCSLRASAQPITALQPAIASLSLNANNTAAPQVGQAFAIPQSCNTISWITSFGSAPASVNTNLEFSNDNSVWESADSSILTTGETRTVFSAARFIRANETARSGGSAVTVSIVCKAGQIGNVTSPLSGGLSVTGNISGTRFLGGNGTVALPTFSFTSEPNLGFFRPGAGYLSFGELGNMDWTTGGGNFIMTSTESLGFANTANPYSGAMDTKFLRAAAGILTISSAGVGPGVDIKVDALPTIASGFGTSPSITAGSTPFAGSVNVGTGASSSGVINFNGTAFPSAPFCVATDDSSIMAVKSSASTTQLTIAAIAFTASDIISWICVSAK